MAGFLTALLYKTGLKKHPKRSELLLKNKNLVVGKNSSIEHFEVIIQDAKPGFTNVTIGDDCILDGCLIIHNPAATVTIGDRVFTGHSTEMICNEGIEIGNDVMLSWGITLLDTNAHSLISEERKKDVINWKKGPSYKDWSVVKSKKLVIQDKCWIGFNSIIMKGITLGTGSIVSAGSVVTKNTEPYTVVGGNPATYIKHTS